MAFAYDAIYKINKLIESITSLIELSRIHQSELVLNQAHVGSLRWLKESCTVKVCGPRRCGHTTAICHLLTTEFNKAVIVATCRKTARILEYTIRSHNLQDRALVRSASSFDTLKGIDDEVEAIIVDNASDYQPDGVELIYSQAIPFAEKLRKENRPFLLVFLQ